MGIPTIAAITALLLIAGCSAGSECNLQKADGSCCAQLCNAECPDGYKSGSCNCECADSSGTGVDDVFGDGNVAPPELP